MICIGGFFLYVSEYYRINYDINNFITTENRENRISEIDNLIIVRPEKDNITDRGFIFYPGAKVEETAYLPLMERLAKEGITSVLIKMPFNLAVFDINAADRVYEKFNDINNWYIGGHSLGGAMASSYISKNQDKLSGLILMGAYPLEDNDIPMISLYGSHDDIINKQKLKLSKNKIEILGGNHGYFGNYSEQKGDGKSTISRDEQQQKSVSYIIEFINRTQDHNN
ncbi:MAG: alpha/beta hydrolase [Oscillospiraceae bacterium]|nr:alpha/beta hydrolase [Oscillospiraceae bacterium]